MGEWRAEPQHKIKVGRVNSWIYRIGGEQSWDYEVESFRWYRPSERAKWRKEHRLSGYRDFHDLARCLEMADRWIAEQDGRAIPQEKELGFAPQEVTAVLHLLGSVRALDTDSPALWEFEKRIRALLDEMNTEQVSEAVSEHEESELFEHIEQIREKLIPYQQAS
jgi:hypothetical protein